MPRGRWTQSDNSVADEAFSVLIHGNKPTRTHTKESLAETLVEEGVYTDFLKLCLEFDESKDLRMFRKGLLIVVRSLGPERVAKRTGINRVSLYRMLSPKGNPRFNSLVRLFEALRVRLWIVDEDFVKRRSRVIRPKDL